MNGSYGIMRANCPACGQAWENGSILVGATEFRSCSLCRTLWKPTQDHYSNYDGDYIRERAHDGSSDGIRKAKQLTFLRFWKMLGKVDGPVLEVGCSAGLGMLAAVALGMDAYGLDVNPLTPFHVQQQGIPSERVSIEGFGKFRGIRFAGVAFFDSFEHIPDPCEFMVALRNVLKPGARMVFVLPDAGSLSRRCMGAVWPHYGPDHWVHYTKRGIRSFLENRGGKVERWFYPVKFISLEIVFRHLTTKGYCQNAKGIAGRLPSAIFPMNFGEMGLIVRF